MKLLYLTLLFLIITSSLSQIQTIQLTSAATIIGSPSTSLSGSLRGGTTIYIFGLGFPNDPRQISVFVGNFPCILPADGSTPTVISCVTSDCGVDTNIYSLPIKVISSGQSYTVPNTYYSYQLSTSPIIYNTYPSSAPCGTLLSYNSYHRVNYAGDGGRDMGDFQGVYVGSSLCSMFDVTQDPVSYNSISQIRCTSNPQQQAGKYNVTERVLAGWAFHHFTLRQSSIIDQYYQQVVLPSISSVTPSTGFSTGQELVIKGSGFSINPSNIAVQVNDTACVVSVSTISQIHCRLVPKSQSQNAILSSSATTQQNGFAGGVGFAYTRYDISNLTSKTITGFQSALPTNTNITLIQTSKRATLKSEQNYGYSYGQVWKGYFYAPVSGDYIFQGVGDQQFSLYLGSDYGSTSTTLNKIIYSNSAQLAMEYFYVSNISTATSSPQTLQSGKYYYMQLYHVNSLGTGLLDISVQVPNTNPARAKQTFQIDLVQTTVTNDPQILQYTLNDAASGTFNLSINRIDTTTLKVIYSNYVTINYNATCSQFLNALNTFDNFATYHAKCLNATQDTSTGTYQWFIQVDYLRPPQVVAQLFKFNSLEIVSFSGSQPTFIQTQVNPHGPVLSGTFTMQIGGTPINIYNSATNTYSISDIPYNASSWDIQSAIAQFSGFENVQVAFSGVPQYGGRWIISFYQYFGVIPPITVSGSALAGGLDGTYPNVASSVARQFSSNILFDPVTQSMLYSVAPSPQVIITVNGVKSVCINDCSYSFIPNIPVITSQTTSGAAVTIGITDPKGYTGLKLAITINDVPCAITSNAYPQLQCSIPTSNGGPSIAAGNYNTQIFDSTLGYIITQQNTPKLTFPLLINSVSPNSGGDNGGYTIQITGTGFPSTAAELQATICGKSLSITSITHTLISAIVPACAAAGSQSITLSYNGFTNSSSFTYNAGVSPATIYSFTPTSSSPVLKSVMTITGFGFTSSSDISVFLSNQTGKVYAMRVLNSNDTVITCGIPGGIAGTYQLQVTLGTLGHATFDTGTSDTFVYQLAIQSISPTTGSYFGGTLLTIIGRNFSPTNQQNVVSVGDEINNFCIFETLTSTKITCRMPPLNPQSTNFSKNIIVTSRIVADSFCSGNNCAFTYTTQNTSPSITTLSSTTVSSDLTTITITGSNFNFASINDVSVVLQNSLTSAITVVNANTASTTSVTFVVPNLQSGSYQVRARFQPIGQTNSLSLTINPTFAKTTLTGSINGGSLLLTGFGLPATWPGQLFTLTLTSNSVAALVNVISIKPSAIQLSILPGVDGKVYSISLTNPLGKTITATFTQSLASTPVVTLLSASSVNSGTQTVQLSKSSILTTIDPTTVSIFNTLNPSNLYPIATWTSSGSTISFNYNLNAGAYGFKLWYADYGWATCTSVLNVKASSTYTLAATTASSYAGGFLTVNGPDISQDAVIKIGGFVGTVVSKTSTSATFELPPLLTPTVTAAYPQLLSSSQITPASIISDGGSNQNSAFDGLHATYYQSSSATCYIGLDVGLNKLVNVNRIRYFPYFGWTIASKYLVGAVFQGSNDNVSYSPLGTVTEIVHAGWNSIQITTTSNYRYIRLRHTSQSNCKLVQLQVHGTVYNNINIANLASFSTPIIFDDGLNTITFTNPVNYSQSATPVISTISPATGSVYGGETITFTGTNFAGTPTVVIDGVPCVATPSTSTSFTCVTGPRVSQPSTNSFQVSFGSNKPILNDNFEYVMRWSDVRTWGTDLPPIEGDLVYVPEGMSLYVDEDTPILAGLVVQNGKLIFADESDMTIRSQLITINGGQFRAGTQDKPYKHKLTFIMYGDYYGPQLPLFGNKGIACFNCKLSMYGTPRPVTWTTISNTINAGANTLTLSVPVDWKVGQSIVVASTDFDHNQAQQKVITAISGQTITVDSPFEYKHFSGVQTYGTNTLQMRAQVGLLSRNIKVMGDQTSEPAQYGAHLMITGDTSSGLVGQVAYSQFTQCGQPRILGRYCIHFHMAGDVPDSYVLGNAVHHSYARILTIHGVRFLTASHNVGYHVYGHNFFVQDGIQTQNTIQYNLVVSSLTSFKMLQTDISVASYWLTNPTNILRYNHAAGGDFYGFWYQIKPNPDGPSATMDVCPIGNPLSESHDNLAHSFVRFGLRIFKLYSRTYPCADIRDDTAADPWASNPSIQSVFSNYTIYKSGQSGILAQQCGNTLFYNFTIAQFKRSAMQYFFTNFTKQQVIAQNMAIIGVTNSNPPTDLSILDGARGAIGPRSSNWRMKNIRFYNMNSQMTILQTCSNCDNVLLFINVGGQYFVQNIQYTNVTSNYLDFVGLQRQIVYDVDGSFSKPFDTKTRPNATIVANYQHIALDPSCAAATSPAKWDNGIACDNTAKVRRVMFTNLGTQSLFYKKPMKTQLIADVSENVSADSTTYTQIYSIYQGRQPQVNKPGAYALPYIAGRTYNIWWDTGLDFTHLGMQVSRLFLDTDPAIIFKFNYTQNRQFYQIGQLVNLKLQLPLITATNATSPLDHSVCNIGDYTHDNQQRVMTLCATSRGKNRTDQYLDVNGIKCRYLCPQTNDNITKQPFVRVWSNQTQWPNQTMPADGDNITIPQQWTILMDMNPAIMDFWMVDGDVIIPQTTPVAHIVAQGIWVRSGSIQAGSPSAPYPGNLTFEIIGNRTDKGFTINQDIAGSKLFVVTGLLSLYGQAPNSVWTVLTSIARKGDTSLSVLSTSGWQIGDQIAIGPSFSTPSQNQIVTIVSITGSSVSFTPALKYTHYGDVGQTIVDPIGTLDTRAAVGHLTRNIQFISGADEGWGYQVIIDGYLDSKGVLRTGSTILSGVQFYNGGQYDTENTVLKLLNTIGTNPITVTASSFHECKSFCLDVNNINNAEFQNNVFYNARVFHVRALSIKNFTFTNNLMISAIQRPTANVQQLVACFMVYKDISQSQVTITNNLCQGSAGHGYVLPFFPCQYLSSPPYSNNTAGSTPIGFILADVPGSCLATSGLKAYACEVGQQASPPSTQSIIFQNIVMADNGRGVTLRFNQNGDNRTGLFQNSLISAISRPTCTQCYGTNAIDCTGNHAVRMLTVTIAGQALPGKYGMGFDVVCKQQVFDCKAFLNNVVFQNYQQVYSSLPQCSSNVIFKPHDGASDLTGSHHLTNVKCNNCTLDAMAYFSQPNAAQIGWFGGCGEILCTGKNNYLVHDHTGDLLGTPSILLANNSWIGENDNSCSFIPNINGYHCITQKFAVLEYENIAPDFKTRIMWPVYLNYEGGIWNTSTNGWREWDWQGKQPQNHRIGRFVSIIQLYQIYNMTFQSQPPIDMRLQIQARSQAGNNNDYLVVKTYYGVPNSIQVSTRNGIIAPIPLQDNPTQPPLDVTKCGSNKFFYQNYTIHYVITGDANCQVRVALTNSIQLSIRLQMDISQFFYQDSVTLFIDRMCAVLGIDDTSRFKVVSGYNGSADITVFIDQSPTTTVDNASLANYDVGKKQVNELNDVITQLSEDGTINRQLTAAGFGNVISLTTVIYYIIPQNDNPINPKLVITYGIAIAVSIILFISLAIFSIIYYSKNRTKVQNQVRDQNSDLQYQPSDIPIEEKKNYLSDSISNFDGKK